MILAAIIAILILVAACGYRLGYHSAVTIYEPLQDELERQNRDLWDRLRTLEQSIVQPDPADYWKKL